MPRIKLAGCELSWRRKGWRACSKFDQILEHGDRVSGWNGISRNALIVEKRRQFFEGYVLN